MKTKRHTSATRKSGWADLVLILVLSVLLCGEAFFGYRLHALSREQEQIKEDFSMSNNITFGLFSVDQWRDKITAIVNKQVNDFSLTPAQKKALQLQVEQALHALINKAVAQMNKPQKSIGGKLKKMAFNAIVNADDIQAQVPSFAKTIINKVNSPASQTRMKGIATSKVNQLAKETYDSTSVANVQVTKYIYAKYHVTDPVEFNKRTDAQLASIRTVTYHYAYAMVGCVILALGLWWLMRSHVHFHTILFVISLLFALVLLLVGITASIIEVDARIQSLNFALLGDNVTFENQVLFFQSKSIFGIVEALLKQTKPDAVVVGSLILLFVIVLPVVRLVARGIHIISPKKIAQNRAVKYLAFQSAKWDMADVMVVGVLMTYIGLNGILKSQLSNLNIHNSLLTTTTANNSSLQPGYFIFVAYVVFAMALSYILKRITPYNAT